MAGAAAALAEEPNVPVKPILMCFICKLSFASAKSFVAHVTSGRLAGAMGEGDTSPEHLVELGGEEREVLGGRDASAILQARRGEDGPCN
jgi:AT-binding transcription factor 1